PPADAAEPIVRRVVSRIFASGDARQYLIRNGAERPCSRRRHVEPPPLLRKYTSCATCVPPTAHEEFADCRSREYTRVGMRQLGQPPRHQTRARLSSKSR